MRSHRAELWFEIPERLGFVNITEQIDSVQIGFLNFAGRPERRGVRLIGNNLSRKRPPSSLAVL